MAKERILLADDHPLVRAALLEAVRRLEGDIEPVEVDSLGAAKAAMAKGPVDLVCLDLHMGDSSGFIGLTELRRDVRWIMRDRGWTESVASTGDED